MRFSKLHGLGNDFLVVLEEGQEIPASFSSFEARALCDRRRGVGADGLIAGRRPSSGESVDIVMELHNADGARAEMSGNGIRCLGHAVAMHRRVEDLDLVIATDAGPRRARVEAGSTTVDGRRWPGGSWCAQIGVSMGSANPGPDLPDDLRHSGRLATVDVGNPHLVIEVDDPSAVDLSVVGPEIESRFAGGVNIEFIRAASTGRIDLVVWERGVGVTSACGTGAVAAAHTAKQWGLVGDHVEVVMPGGSVEVTLGDELRLVGPSVHVAEVEVDLPSLLAGFSSVASDG